MTNYRRGRTAEYRVIRQLTAAGYTCVRAAASKGPWDVLAWKPEEPVRHIQVKSEKHRVHHTYPALLEQLALTPCSRDGQRELWVWSQPLKAWRLIVLVDGPGQYRFLLHQT